MPGTTGDAARLASEAGGTIDGDMFQPATWVPMSRVPQDRTLPRRPQTPPPKRQIWTTRTVSREATSMNLSYTLRYTKESENRRKNALSPKDRSRGTRDDSKAK